MPVDRDDSTAVTAELPPPDGGRAGSGPAVFSGQARPVVLSDLELALLDGSGDPSVHRDMFRAPPGGDGEGERVGSPPPASFIAHGIVVVILAIPVILVVALGFALAAR
jgi:hypothetical protein